MIPAADLDGLPLLDGLAPAVRRTLAARAIEKRYATGQVLFRAGDGAKGLFVVLGGRVRIARHREGRGQVVHVEERGGTLGEIPLFTGAPYPATATALEPTRCLIFTREAVLVAIAADPELALRLLAGLAARTRELIARLDRLAFASVRQRLASFILGRAARSSGPVVSLGSTHGRIAEELGTVREVVVKELAALRAAGLIRARGAGRIEVLDAAGLERAASARATSPRRAPGPGGARRDARPRSTGR
jgi:CRP-like cAMP-binding protein